MKQRVGAAEVHRRERSHRERQSGNCDRGYQGEDHDLPPVAIPPTARPPEDSSNHHYEKNSATTDHGLFKAIGLLLHRSRKGTGAPTERSLEEDRERQPQLSNERRQHQSTSPMPESRHTTRVRVAMTSSHLAGSLATGTGIVSCSGSDLKPAPVSNTTT